MIGNDVVDLALAQKESNWKRRGFLDKIFTKDEQLLISKSENPEVMVWNLWSRKEAAYKIYNRQTGIRGFIPLQLECFYENAILGTVFINGNRYFTKTTISNDAMHTIAVTKTELFEQIKLVTPKTKIDKINGIPFVFESNNKRMNPASISHHGRFTECITI